MINSFSSSYSYRWRMQTIFRPFAEIFVNLPYSQQRYDLKRVAKQRNRVSGSVEIISISSNRGD